MSTIAKQAPIGLFDLPLELRRQIYQEAMPLHYQLQPQIHRGENNIEALRNTHPQIAHELEVEEKHHHRQADFRVTSTEWKAPRPLYHSRIDHISIQMEVYPPEQERLQHPPGEECHCRHPTDIDTDIDTDTNTTADPTTPRCLPAHITTMTDNLTRFVAWVHKSCADVPLQRVDITFDTAGTRWTEAARQEHWTEAARPGEEDGEEDRKELRSLATIATTTTTTTTTTMTTTTESHNPDPNESIIPIMEHVLAPLHSFPTAKHATILEERDEELSQLCSWEELEAEGLTEVLYDTDYQYALWDSWQNWLRGERGVARKRQMVDLLRGERPGVERLLLGWWGEEEEEEEEGNEVEMEMW